MLPQVYPCNLHIDIPLSNFITYPCADPDPQINTRAKTQTHELILALKPGPVMRVSVYHGYGYGLHSQCPRVTRALAYLGLVGLLMIFCTCLTVFACTATPCVFTHMFGVPARLLGSTWLCVGCLLGLTGKLGYFAVSRHVLMYSFTSAVMPMPL